MTAVTVRAARPDDVEAMVELIERYRAELERWQPHFWRKAAASASMSRMWFAHLVAAADKATCLVAERDGDIAGFLIATPIPVPPVYAVAGPVWNVDDFCVADPALWNSVGPALWGAISDHGRQAGWSGLICVSPVDDDAKNAMLDTTPLTPKSRWWWQAL